MYFEIHFEFFLVTIILYCTFLYVFLKLFPFCLVFTQITSVPHTSMNRIQISFKNSVPCCIVITLITSVPHISLNRFYMCFKNSFPFCLVITLITCVKYISMKRVYMSFCVHFLSHWFLLSTKKKDLENEGNLIKIRLDCGDYLVLYDTIRISLRSKWL